MEPRGGNKPRLGCGIGSGSFGEIYIGVQANDEPAMRLDDGIPCNLPLGFGNAHMTWSSTNALDWVKCLSEETGSSVQIGLGYFVCIGYALGLFWSYLVETLVGPH
ncbi:hypothetical protein Taro_002862 [Colocasia esculenta]|uniref:Uncharacterized protein n=1 Tax=Colocasia esculenta TaxID=4460 RepID=A0A843TIA2_COLES|nr:hypothetical protein [Colocasia esculenta]